MSWSELQGILAERRTSRPEPDMWGTPPSRASHAGPGRQWRDLQSLAAADPTVWAELDVWGPPPPATVHAGGGGRWWDLAAALARDQIRPVVGVECPNDGFRLLPAPHGGGLWCPFDGWRGRPDEAAPAVRRPATPAEEDPYTALYESTY